MLQLQIKSKRARCAGLAADQLYVDGATLARDGPAAAAMDVAADDVRHFRGAAHDLARGEVAHVCAQQAPDLAGGIFGDAFGEDGDVRGDQNLRDFGIGRQAGQPAVNGGENLQGKNFTTQTHKIDIYPDHKGILTVPSFRVTFKQSMEVYGQLTSQPVQLATEQLLGLVSVPPAMAGETGFMVSSDVKITDDWSGDEKGEFKVGDVLTRVVTIVAADMASMNMPQFTPYAPSGVSVTLAEPRLSSTSGREEAAATMVQHISYAVESPGQYTLGTEVLSWWDPKAASRRDHRFADKPVDAGGLPWRLVAIVVSVSVPVLLLILVMRRYLRRRDAVDVAIRQQLHRGDASKRLAALYAYADYHKLQGEQPVRLRALLPASQALVEKVMSARYSSNGIDGEPSRGESKSLYRQMRKDFPC